MTRQANSTVASARPTRVPLSSRNRLDIKNKEAGYSYRIVNDVDDRIDRFLRAGYEICTTESVGPVGSKRVDGATPLGSAAHFSVGKGTSALVLRIKDEYAKEDAAAKLADIAAVEETMKGDARKKSDYGDIDFSR